MTDAHSDLRLVPQANGGSSRRGDWTVTPERWTVPIGNDHVRFGPEAVGKDPPSSNTCTAGTSPTAYRYRRLHGELLVLGVKVAASTVWEILREAGIDPASQRARSTWADFLRSQAEALLACDFLEAVTLSGARMFVLAVIEHHSRRIRILGVTAHPCAPWVVQAAKNLVMDLEDTGCRARYLIRDRDGKFPELFDTALADAGIEVVLTGVRMPRMSSTMERWVQTCRRELLDRILIWTSTTYSAPSASSNTSTTSTAPTRASPTPARSIRCRHRSSTQNGSPA